MCSNWLAILCVLIARGHNSTMLKLLCMCRMISVLIRATAPCRSPELHWCHQSYTSFCFVSPHILHVRKTDRDWGLVYCGRGGSGGGGGYWGSEEVHEWRMRVDKGKWFELSYCVLRLQATLICDTQIGYCNSTPRALVAQATWTGDRVKDLQCSALGGLFALWMFHQLCLWDD